MSDEHYKPHNFYFEQDGNIVEDGHTLTNFDIVKNLNSYRFGFLKYRSENKTHAAKNRDLEDGNEAMRLAKYGPYVNDAFCKEIKTLTATITKMQPAFDAMAGIEKPEKFMENIHANVLAIFALVQTNDAKHL